MFRDCGTVCLKKPQRETKTGLPSSSILVIRQDWLNLHDQGSDKCHNWNGLSLFCGFISHYCQIHHSKPCPAMSGKLTGVMDKTKLEGQESTHWGLSLIQSIEQELHAQAQSCWNPGLNHGLNSCCIKNGLNPLKKCVCITRAGVANIVFAFMDDSFLLLVVTAGINRLAGIRPSYIMQLRWESYKKVTK